MARGNPNILELRGKRIIVVLGNLELGGAERQALLLARYLRQECAADVQVWGFHGPGRASELCEQYRIPWRLVSLPWPRSQFLRLRGLMRFARTLRQMRPDIVLPYTMFPNVACGLVWRWTGARLCVWNQRDEGLHRMGKRVERLAVQHVRSFIANSEGGASFLVQTFGLRSDRVHIIHNGVELAPPVTDRPGWRSRLGVDGEHFVACMVANLDDRKDHATLLRAWQMALGRLTRDGSRAVLLLAGAPGNACSALKALAYDLALGNRVRFLGQIHDVSGLLGACDVAVYSSRSEGCPNSVLECMAAGLAVAATDIPGIREAMGSDGFPFLALIGDAESLADRICKLAEAPDVRAALGAKNKVRIDTQFDPRSMCEAMVELITHELHV